MDETSSSKPRKSGGDASWVGFGLALGVAFGVLFDSLAIGIALGLALGVAMSGTNRARKTKK